MPLARSLFFALLFSPLPLLARPGESTTVEFPQAYRSALAFAKADGVDFADRELHSIELLRTEYSKVADRKWNDDYAVHFRKPLKGKEYWLACFGPKKPMLGGGSCYAIERGSLRLLSTHRTR